MGGTSCQIHNAVLYEGDVFLRLSDVAACQGGTAQLNPTRGVIDARINGELLTIWPWGDPVAVRNGLEIITLPENPWFWHEGGFYVRPEMVEVWSGMAIGMRTEPELMAIRLKTPVTYATDTAIRGPSKGLKILIDPGHGGDDEGAVDDTGTPEKEIVLAVGARLAALLDAMGFDVKMTRNSDTYPTLQERVELANDWDADLMLSLHCNSAPRKSATGIETYILSRTASDPRALALAQFENAYEDKQVDSGGLVGQILGDVAREAQENTASRLASVFHREFISELTVEDRGVRKAPFFVLAGTTMPAFLVELGFLSNAEEAQLLRDSNYQKELAGAIAAAVVEIAPFLKMRAGTDSGRDKGQAW